MKPPSDSFHQLDDESLAARAQGNPDAFAELYRRHLDRVYRYHMVRIGEVIAAQDLTAQTFLAALEGIAGYRGQSVFVAWLLRIARNKVADHFRWQKPVLSLDRAGDMPSPAASVEDLAVGGLRMAQVAQAMRALSPARAEALALRFFGGLSFAEVGAVMGKSKAAAKMLVQRGLGDLKKALTVQEMV